jgi:subtilisin family serine protease
MRTAMLVAVALVSFHAPRITAAGPARELVVGLKSTPAASRAAPARLAARLEGLGVQLTRRLADGLPAPRARVSASLALPSPFEIDPARVWLLEAADSADAASAARVLASDPEVAWVEPNVVREPADAALPDGFPDDPMFRDGRQWGLRNLGAGGAYNGVAGADVDALAAWATCVGSNALLLAIADTGIDPNHPDLAGTLPDGAPRIAWALNVTSEPGGAVADSFGHGTFVAGVMAARSGEGPHFDSLGVAGVCGGDGRSNLGCRIVPIKIAPGHSGLASSFDIARAILYATDLGARAVNLSFAGGGESAVERGALYYALTRGCAVVAAAGNRGNAAPQYPAAYAADGLCIAVGASDSWDRRAAFSSYGPWLDVVAPGLDIWTTFMTYPSAAGFGTDGYIAVSGTSFAAPFVTGAVGLLATLRPELTDTDFQHLIRESARDVGPPGIDAETGWGRLDLAAALAALPPAYGIWHDEVAGERLIPLDDDTLRVSDPGPGTMELMRGLHPARLVAVETTVTLPDSFLGAVRVWPRIGGTWTVCPGFRLRYFAPWCEVVTGVDPDARSFTLRGYLYQVNDDALPAGVTDAWVPVPPDQARFGFTVIGPVRRPPPLGVAATPAASGLRASPNPFRDGVRFAGPAGARLTVTDVGGRIVARLSIGSGSGVAMWDGRGPQGQLLAPGIYLARCDVAGHTQRLKLVKLDGRR